MITKGVKEDEENVRIAAETIRQKSLTIIKNKGKKDKCIIETGFNNYSIITNSTIELDISKHIIPFLINISETIKNLNPTLQLN